MKIHTDKLTEADLYASRPSGVAVEWSPCGSRKRACGFHVTLTYYGPEKRRPKNSGHAGAYGDRAATWDEWGIWIARLYEIDPGAVIGCYADRDDFYATTAKWQPRGMHAPWVKRYGTVGDAIPV